MKAEGSRPPPVDAAYGTDGGFGGQFTGENDNGPRGNNYSRPSGQNVSLSEVCRMGPYAGRAPLSLSLFKPHRICRVKTIHMP